MKINDEAVELASAILEFRRCRSEVLPKDLFGEPSWELLLEVFVADAAGVPMTGRIVAKRHGIAGSVLSRWLMHLTAEGLLIGDGNGNLDDELTLSGTGMEKMETVMHKARFLKNAIVPGSQILG